MTVAATPARTLRSASELIDAGLAPASARAALDAVAARYAVAITPAMAALIERGDEADPIARQFVPDIAELATRADERADPIGDAAHSPVKGVVHRYPDRVLLKPTHACPVYCRVCFRREQVGPGGEALEEAELDAALAYVRERPAIREVILTGGDPLVLSARRLARIVRALDAIDHVEIVRVHSRVPVVDPARVTPALVAALALAKAPWLAIHANHPREFTREARAALARLAQAGIALVGQSVLLRGVNDDAATLEALMRAFVANRVKPYYLHHLDPAPGTARFRVPLARGRALVKALRGRVSGLAQPTYVLDIEGGAGKVPLGPEFLREDGTVEDPWGGVHRAPDRG